MQTGPTTLDDENSLYAAVLNDISNGELRAGQRLKIVELAKRYRVSASPVREVLRRMQGEGYVAISPNRGATVLEADASTVQNIFEFLQLLEPYLVGWVAEFAQPDLLDEMERIQQSIEETEITDLARFRRLDTEFHGAICQRHYNRQVAESWRHLRRSLNVHGARLVIKPARFQAIMSEHRALLEALRQNDATAAVSVIKTHLEGSFVQMSQQMRSLGL